MFEDLFRRGMVSHRRPDLAVPRDARPPASTAAAALCCGSASAASTRQKIIEETPNGASGYSGIDKATRAEMIESCGVGICVASRRGVMAPSPLVRFV